MNGFRATSAAKYVDEYSNFCLYIQNAESRSFIIIQRVITSMFASHVLETRPVVNLQTHHL